MRAVVLVACLVLALAAIGPAAAAQARDASLREPVFLDPDFGAVRLYAPKGAPTSVIVVLSDADGFGREETRLSLGFVVRGSLVIGLDWPTWRHRAAQDGERDCADLLGAIEGIVLRVERARGVSPFLTPVLAGIGIGGSAARALAPQAASHRIAGVVAVKAGAFLQTATPLCGGIAHKRADGYVYEAPPRAMSPVLREAEDEDAAADAAEALEERADPHGPGDLADLPLFVTMPTPQPSALAVLLTGDGGMGVFDRSLANALSARGVGVVTIDSRRYFWARREPAAVARDIERIIAHFRAGGVVRRVGLAGYSYGADILPLAYAKLAPKVRADVAAVSLLALAPAIDLRIELDDEDYANALPLLDDAARIDAPSVQCIYGEDDASAAMACPALGAVRPGVTVHKTAGGHGFNGDADTVADLVAGPLLSHARRHG